MADYQKMYTTLFNAITDAISILQQAQQVTEEIYLSEDDSDTTDEEERDS